MLKRLPVVFVIVVLVGVMSGVGHAENGSILPQSMRAVRPMENGSILPPVLMSADIRPW